MEIITFFSILLSLFLVALIGLGAQTFLLKQLVDNANHAIKGLEKQLAAARELP
jgi:hypothetical protein